MLATTMTEPKFDRDDLFVAVRTVVLRLDIPDLEPAAVMLGSRLVEDLGVDSLRFVDLTVGLEEALALDEFPMQEWVDECISRGVALTIGELVDACERLGASAGP
jgi:acyl carrier protein